jgi:bifunctional DNA-binding transcriptional regulator/antitoxin component of YhaV-PrlF toxin-antitoxin module
MIGRLLTLPLDNFSNVTSKRQVTFPAAVLQALGATPGSHLELQPRGD